MFKHVLLSVTDSRFTCLHSFSCLMDWLILAVTFGLGVYTLWLAIQTCVFVRRENSLIDHMKFERWQSNPRKYKP